MEALDILKAARDIISDPDRWTTGAYARNAYGRSVSPMSPKAVCFCAYGAVEKAAGSVAMGRIAAKMLDHVAKAKYGDDVELISDLNDLRVDGHACVMHVFDTAVNKLTDEAAKSCLSH